MLWNLLKMLVFVGIVVIARQSLLDAAVYFFMYLQIAKLFTAHSARDTLWIYVEEYVPAAILASGGGLVGTGGCGRGSGDSVPSSAASNCMNTRFHSSQDVTLFSD